VHDENSVKMEPWVNRAIITLPGNCMFYMTRDVCGQRHPTMRLFFIYHPPMCLILFAWKAHSRYPLVVAANRDEYHERPTAAAMFWEQSPEILAGRDLQADGTWLGISRNGRFAAISNYREPMFRTSPLEYSRGHLVRDFLLGKSSPAAHSEYLYMRGIDYRGFNLLLGDPDALFYVSNRNTGPTTVSAGSHGLSNHLLDTDWPKVHSGRARIDSLLEDEYVDPEALLEMLADQTAISCTGLPVDEMKSEAEEITKRIFIVSPIYGTRSSTVLLLDCDGEVTFVERQFDNGGNPIGTHSYSFRMK